MRVHITDNKTAFLKLYVAQKLLMGNNIKKWWNSIMTYEL